jgi:cytochrome c553
MHRVLRWIRNMVLAFVALVLLAAATLYALSERIVRRSHEAPLVTIPIPADSASVAEGSRLAWVHGCRGCHTETLAGQYFEDDFLIGRIVAPNLTLAAQQYSDPELVRIIRRGVRPDGRSVLAMPSEMFAPLTDADLGKIIAYIRSLAPVPGFPRSITLGPMAWLGLVTHQYSPSAVLVAKADSITASGYYPAGGEPNADGAYLARTACSECHGLTLNGDFGPDLRIAAGYTPEQFAHFFKTGEALGGRETKMMSGVARNRFSRLTDAEVSAIYAYLVARAATLPDSTAP